MATRIAVPKPVPRLARTRIHHGRRGGEGISHTSAAAATRTLSPGSPGHADRLLGPPPELLRSEGRLYYAGAVSAESPLSPMTEDLFEVEADPTVRLRFVGVGTRTGEGLIGIYSDGTIDEWARSD
jgi:hypothetical protein